MISSPVFFSSFIAPNNIFRKISMHSEVKLFILRTKSVKIGKMFWATTINRVGSWISISFYINQ